MMKISLIHPSRGRPQKSRDNVYRWMNKSLSEDPHDIEVIVMTDFSDPALTEYEKLYKGGHKVYVGNHNSVVEATNAAAKIANGDILIYLSDDFDCPDDWDELVRKEFEGIQEPTLVKVDDCLQGFQVPVLTIPMMNRALYEKLGYFWHPAYKSMFVDEDLYWTTRKHATLKMCPHLKFPHEHVSVGKAQDDETYRRSAANWEQGKATFAQRKKLGFPL